MRIAILGWGSLIGDPGDLPRLGDWQPGGPVLPIEFSRVSAEGRLTLVIDPANGQPVSTRFITSARSHLDRAIGDLRVRERTIAEYIGYVNLNLNLNRARAARRCRTTAVADTVRDWASVHGFDAVIWTDLRPNFEVKTGGPFSVERAVEYLHSLVEPTAQAAREYIQGAPEEVDTPLRRRLQEDDWLRP
ncbi:MAG: hypothetical protein HYY04_08175 [Chloroflexi bacterium]|nr:hypothetical protein [Chloroflexota bacterium]